MPEASRLDLLDADTTRAARLFLSAVARHYAVRAAVLFGSRARGGFRPDSDADIAVLLEGPYLPFLTTKLELADIAYDGEEILPTLSAELIPRYVRGFSARNLWRMMQFAEAFPDEQIVATLTRQFNCSHVHESPPRGFTLGTGRV